MNSGSVWIQSAADTTEKLKPNSSISLPPIRNLNYFFAENLAEFEKKFWCNNYRIFLQFQQMVTQFLLLQSTDAAEGMI